MKHKNWILAVVCLLVVVTVVTLSVVLTRDKDSKDNKNKGLDGDTNENNNNNNSTTTTRFVELPLVSLSGPNSTNITIDASTSSSSTTTTTTILQLPKAQVNTLVTLVQLAADGMSFKPMGRSYDGNEWETSAGYFAGKITFHCSQQQQENNENDMDVCTVTLPETTQAGSNVVVYQVTAFPKPNYRDRDVMARFLEQTTFGVTTKDLDELEAATSSSSGSSPTNSAFAQWIKEQQTDTPYMSHRALFRRHLNAQFPLPNPLGPITVPCQATSRYRLSAFHVKDMEKLVSIQTLPSSGNNKALIVDGHVRTVVGKDIYIFNDQTQQVELATQAWPDGEYTICFVVEVFDNGEPISVLLLDHHENLGDCVPVLFQLSPFVFESNPRVRLDELLDNAANNSIVDLPPPLIVELADQDAKPIDVVYNEGYDPLEQDIILQNSVSLENCPDSDTWNPNDEIPVFVRWNNRLYIHDPRFVLLDNDLKDPLADGGGEVVRTFANPFQPEFTTRCANVPRTFLNEEHCRLSTFPTVCPYTSREEQREEQDNANGPETLFPINHESLRAIYEVTGAGAPGTVYAYAIGNLDISRDPDAAPPCRPGSVSRWVSGPCTSEGPSVSFQTNALMGNIISRFNAQNQNTMVLDIFHPQGLDFSCTGNDLSKVGFEVTDIDDKDLCWRNVHADHLKVYDFSSWVVGHPGNSATRNPITEVAEAGNTTLLFPSWHELNRWNDNKGRFGGGEVSLGDTINFYDLPSELITEELANALGINATLGNGGVQGDASSDRNGATMVCGSPFEIASDPKLGGSQGKGAFDALTVQFQTTAAALNAQRHMIWTRAVLEDPAQLRQRMAWALSQILVISPGGITEGQFLTEAFVAYYDIFVRNAFGNYRNVLKEVAYSVMMADMLTFLAMKSTAATWEEDGVLNFADENFAREVLQLFTTGLFRLNQDGTEIEGAESVYSNDDIEEYARAWTGFVMQTQRGNIEAPYINRVDPARVVDVWRDRFPKMGLDRKYVGDGYPLCADLPPRHFLAVGAKYRLLGSLPSPEMQRDPTAWLESDSGAVHLSLNVNSRLYGKLCNPSASTGECTFSPQVVLDETISCIVEECEIDTVRTVDVNGIFYEYVQQPCVQQAFFQDPKTIVRRVDGIQMCGDPRVEVATTACCDGDGDPSWEELYWGEKTKYQTSEKRCGGKMCGRDNPPNCEEEAVGSQCYNLASYWTPEPCQLRIKINEVGKVAIVHHSSAEDDSVIASLVREHTQTFFRVDWEGDFGILTTSCASQNACTLIEDNACVCDVSVVDEKVFVGPTTPSLQEIVDELHIGADSPNSGPSQSGDIMVFNVGGDGMFTESTIFEYIDEFGVLQRRKNVRSKVFVEGTTLSFRNPPHFISLTAPETRDAHHETDAVLDHYMYNSNTAPFLAVRFAQRFGISNPSPRYVKSIADAFAAGTYSHVDGTTFGTGTYGDLAATVAALLLDKEARNIVLDADPTHGAFKEPLLKLTGLYRSMQLELKPGFPWLEFMNTFGDRIGQMAHSAPSVFSFFLPEYQPSGRVSQGSLVAPEAQVLTGPRIIDTFNGIFSLMKYGHTFCFGGFAPRDRFERFAGYRCPMLTIGNSDPSLGSLTYVADDNSSPEDAVEELATLMTAGRLNPGARKIVQDVYKEEQNGVGMIKAQMLVAASPEFHVTNLVRQNGQQRKEKPPAAPSSKPYRAVINIQLQGGVDSYNMLAPHRCTAKNPHGQTLLEQYNNERSTIAFNDGERTRIIDAVNQPCDQFAIHPNLPVVERLYNEGELAFMANIGQLDAPVTKQDYIFETRTELFAHNTMQRQSQRIDPWDVATGTGMLGRMSDLLSAQGFSAQPITIAEATVATVGAPGGDGPSPLIVSARGLSQFAPRPRAEAFDIKKYLPHLNNATDIHSSIYGETWSDRFQKAVVDSEQLSEAIFNVQLTQSYPADGGDYVRKIQTLVSLILTHKERGTDRDLFWMNLGSWDHHENLKLNLASEFQLLNGGLALLEQELKAQGYYDNVTIVLTSDFARTLTANSGTGSDHAWGGNLFFFGGSVRGNHIFGDYPSDITQSGPLNVGRGRLIPTLSWESMFNGIAEWMGIDTTADLDYCLPNRHRTGTRLFSKSDLFRDTASS